MSVSTEILAVLVTVACGVMTVNMAVMKFLWDDIKQMKRDHAETKAEVAEKAGIADYCEPKHVEYKREINELFCRKVDEIKRQLDDIWDRINHHSHDPKTGKVIVE